MSDDQAREMRPETTSEHIARDMREGRFPEQSERQMVPVLASLPHEIQVWRSMDALDHTGTWSTTRYPAEAVTYVSKADAQAAVALMVAQAATQADPWDGPVTKNKIVDAQAIAAQQIKARIRALAPADGLAAVEALRERAEKAEQERDAAVRGRNDWRDDFKALAAAIVGDTGLSAMTVAAQARTFRPRAEKAEADRDRLAAELAQARADTDAAVALVVERAATEVSLNAWRHEGEDAYSKGMDAGARHQAQVIYNAIRALTPVDGLAMVQELRAEMDTLAAENASLKAAKAVAG